MKLLPLFFLTPALAFAQALNFPTPVITSISPLGGQPGKTLDLVVKGTDLAGLRAAHLSPDPGAPVEAGPKLDAKGKPVANTLTLTLPDAANPGIYELRVVGDFGISNPRVFQISPRPEANSPGTNEKPDTALKVKANSVLHGVFKNTAPHWFEFSGKAGQRVFAVFDGAAFDVRTRLSGSLHDADGRETARLRDGWLAATLPAGGVYRLKIHDLMHGAGDDYAYRLTLTTGPVVFSRHHDPSDESAILHGWNLPGGESIPSLQVRPGPPLERLVTDATTAGQLITGSPLPVLRFGTETEPASAATDQPVSLAIGQTHTGWFPAHGAARVFDLAFKKGDRFIIEVESALRGLPTDPFLLVESLKKDDPGAETLNPQAEVNDMPALIPAPSVARVPLLDPAYAFEAKDEGIFRLTVSDPLNAANGRRYPYTLRVRTLDDQDTRAAIAMHALLPRPAPIGPHLIAPANAWRGGISVIEVALPLRTAQNGPLEIRSNTLPAGVTCLGGFAGKGQRMAYVAFQAADDAPPGSAILTDLPPALHLSRTAADTNREFLFTRLGGPPALAVVDQAAPARLELAAVNEVKAGEKIEIIVKAQRATACTEAIPLKVIGLGDPAKAPAVTIPAKAAEAKLVLDTKALALAPGEYGFILQGPAVMPVGQSAPKPASFLVHSNPVRLRVK